MSIYQLLCLVGFPTVCAGCVTAIIHNLRIHLKDNDKKTDAVQIGVQALLRSQMISDYNKWTTKGYAPIYARENFQNLYEQYHALKGNGVMTDIYNKFMALPTPLDDGGN